MAGVVSHEHCFGSVGHGLIAVSKMPDSLPDEVRRIIGDILEIDASAIGEDAEMGTIEQWDSGNHVSLVLALEEEFGVSFDVPEIEAMTSFPVIVSTLEKKL
jgi:acyl carrier protein